MAVISIPPAALGEPESLVLVHIDAPAPEDWFAPGMVVNGAGWVIAEAEITEIGVFLDDEFMGHASYGLARPEVAERFPHFVQAEAAGFKFSFPIGNHI